MRPILSLAVLSSLLLANEANLDVIKPIREFVPPPVITPNVAQSAFVENQFDRTQRGEYPFVTNLLDNSADMFHISAGMYGKSFYNSSLFKYRGANFYTILNANFTKANNYKDGSGKRWNYGYNRQGQSAILGFVPNDLSELRLTFLRDNIDKDKQPEHVMDAFKTTRKVGKLNIRLGEEDLSNTLNFEFILKKVERKADNFHLRDATQNVKVDLKRNIFEANLKYDADFASFHNQIGAGFEKDKHDGKRYMKQGNNWVFNGYRFADVRNDKFMLFDTLAYKFNEANEASLALKYEEQRSKLNGIDTKFFVQNPIAPNTTRKLIRQIYGEDVSDKIKKDAFSASLKYKFTPNDKDSYFAKLESLSRLPSNMERFNALYGAGDNGWIANPNLEPERHNRAVLGFKFGSEFYKEYLNSLQNKDAFSFGGHFIADSVKNLIIFDRRHSKAPMPLNKNAVISRNVDATLYSVNFNTEYSFARHFGLKSSLYYNYGQNKTDGRPLYQIRPFEANFAFDYKDYASFGSYNLGTALRLVSKQTRGDFSKQNGLGIDKKEAAKGFGLLDLYGGVEFKNKVGIRFGVANLFDKDYAEFISGDHVAALDPVVVHAPGRTFFISFHSSF
ncbi:TonB-dependent receptor domain-containing protein [Campylobacter concisus]|uniref:TonB-dependent receptor domain-containing protein n=2 Tax=Campylobacter concisus TaxID=199 RepID=UPI000D2FD982|nr:TonB-dependent receptor [Campylobacter concisus]